MVRKTVNDKVNELSEKTKQRIVDLVSKGKSITYIENKLKVDYKVIQTYLWQVGMLPWQGAKKIIALRLNKLRHVRLQDERAQLADEIREQVDYLYFAAKNLAEQLRVKKIVKL